MCRVLYTYVYYIFYAYYENKTKKKVHRVQHIHSHWIKGGNRVRACVLLLCYYFLFNIHIWGTCTSTFTLYYTCLPSPPSLRRYSRLHMYELDGYIMFIKIMYKRKHVASWFLLVRLFTHIIYIWHIYVSRRRRRCRVMRWAYSSYKPRSKRRIRLFTYL